MAGTVVKIKQSAVAGRLPTHNTGNATDIAFTLDTIENT